MSDTPIRITAEEFDRLFDEGETDMFQFCDMSRARVVYPTPEGRVTVLVSDMKRAELDKQAAEQ